MIDMDILESLKKHPKAFYHDKNIALLCGDTLEVLKSIPDEAVDCIITSPPYWNLRNYQIEGQLGLEKTLQEYIENMLFVTAECKRALKKTGVMFWNHGDCYGSGSGAGSREGTKQGTNKGSIYYEDTGKKAVIGYEKCMLLQNYRLVIQMIDSQGWILRNDIKWVKPNAMPSSVKDRFANKYEPVFMFVKNKRYWFDLDAVRIPHKDIQDYQRHAPFNYRVREAKRGHDGIVGVKSNEKEMKRYNTAGRVKMSKLPNPQVRENHDIHIDGSGYSPRGKNPGDVWKIPTHPFPESHFATFPEKLIEIPIKAGCPKEICNKCGKARERILKPTDEYAKKLGKSWHGHSEDNGKGAGQKCDGGAVASYETIGWTDCNCGEGFNLGIVLDIFAGSCTTGKVALKLGRKFIGIEIKKEYLDMALRTRLKERYFEF